jgi:hypothetical protein
MAAALRAGFWKVQGPLLGGLGLFVAFVAWRQSWDYPVPLWLVVLGTTAAIIGIFVLVYALDHALRLTDKQLPAIRWAGPAPPNYLDAKAILILEPSDLYALGSVVALYRDRDAYEEFVGMGRVESIQHNGRVQIALQSVIASAADAVDSLLKNESTTLRNYLVKPNVPARGFFSTEEE